MAGEALFPIRRIWCVARSYATHAREMGDDPAREPPPSLREGERVPYPPATADLQHEVELIAAIRCSWRDIPSARGAMVHVFGYTVGLDLTRRDLQTEARQAGRPWDMAKGFDCSTPCSLLQPAASIGHPSQGAIVLAVNGIERQRGDLADMIWPVADIIARLSTLVALAAGDLVFPGTPEGVASVGRGDRLSAAIEGVGGLEITIV